MELPINKRDITIPEEVIQKWQSIVNIMAELIDVPAALIMKVDPPYIEVFRSSESSKNPYKAGGREHLTGLYCEQVIKTRSKLLVPNALKDKHWDKNPDIKLGMISYLGLPLLWPDDEVFGTICVLDLKENRYSKAYEQLMLQFKELVEAHLGLLHDREHLGDLIGQRTAGLKKATEEPRKGVGEHKQAEDEVRQSRANMKSLIESTEDLIWSVDKDYRLLTSNSAFKYFIEPLYGKTIEPGLLLIDSEKLEAEMLKRYKAFYDRALNGETFTIETNTETREEVECLAITYNPIRDEKDEIFGVSAFGRNITERKKAEMALRESEARLRSVFRAAPLGIGLVANRVLLKVNDRICQMVGYSRDELIGKNARILYPTDEDYEYVGREKYGQVREKGTGSVETRWKHKDGTVIDVFLSSTALVPDDPSVGVTFTALDITERKKTEQELQESEQCFQQVLENTQEWIWEVDINGLYTYASPMVEKILGYKPEEIVGKKHFYDLFHPEDRKDLKQEALEAFAGKQSFREFINRNVHKNGETVWLSTSGVPVLDEKGDLLGFRGADMDITERKQAEEQIWRKTAVVEAINKVFQETLVCETEEQVAYTCINMAEELTGSKYGLIGEVNETGRFDTLSYGDLGWAICKMPESKAISLSKNMELRGIWAQAILKEKSQIVNNPTSHPDSVGIPEGHPPITSFLGVPLKHAGKTIGMIGLANKEGGYGPADQEAVESLSVAFVEALRRKRAEQALENLNKELEATVEELTLANRELQHFAHITAHDLKAPLRAIGTLADWISTDYADKFDEEGKRDVELLVGRVARMSDMIDSILRYSEAGRVIKEKEKVNLNALIEEVIVEIAPPENISVTVENELPVVEGEKNHFMQVFQNLLSNAVKYMDKPQGQIKVGCIEENSFWKFNVADNGPGIEKEYFEKIFEMFQTLLPRDEFEATGVGLSVVKKIVELYGGSVWVESEFGKGSVFFFTLPNQEMKVADDAKLQANIVS